MSLLAAAALGAGLGVFTGMPLGVINVAVVESALAARPRDHRALRIFPRVAVGVLIASGAIGLVRLWLGWSS